MCGIYRYVISILRMTMPYPIITISERSYVIGVYTWRIKMAQNLGGMVGEGATGLLLNNGKKKKKSGGSFSSLGG